MPDDIRVDLASDPRLLTAVRGLIRSYLLSAGFSAERASEVVLAVDEACTNAMRHAYNGDTAQRLRLTLRRSAAHIDIVVRDTGAPIEESRCTRRELEPPDPDGLQPGGLGVQLMYRVFDRVWFYPGRERGNRVRMRLKIPRPAEPKTGEAD